MILCIIFEDWSIKLRCCSIWSFLSSNSIFCRSACSFNSISRNASSFSFKASSFCCNVVSGGVDLNWKYCAKASGLLSIYHLHYLHWSASAFPFADFWVQTILFIILSRRSSRSLFSFLSWYLQLVNYLKRKCSPVQPFFFLLWCFISFGSFHLESEFLFEIGKIFVGTGLSLLSFLCLHESFENCIEMFLARPPSIVSSYVHTSGFQILCHAFPRFAYFLCSKWIARVGSFSKLKVPILCPDCLPCLWSCSTIWST